jgi:hypothetical protein
VLDPIYVDCMTQGHPALTAIVIYKETGYPPFFGDGGDPRSKHFNPNNLGVSCFPVVQRKKKRPCEARTRASTVQSKLGSGASLFALGKVSDHPADNAFSGVELGLQHHPFAAIVAAGAQSRIGGAYAPVPVVGTAR